MTRRAIVARLSAGVVWAVAASGTLAGQAPVRRSPPVIRYGKWIALGSSLVFGMLSQAEHVDADRAFSALEDYCLTDQTRCDTGPDGHYLDPVSEGHYQASLTHDRRAGRWLWGGEALFLSAAAGFIWELARPRGPPENIPFAPLIENRKDRLNVGATVRF